MEREPVRANLETRVAGRDTADLRAGVGLCLQLCLYIKWNERLLVDYTTHDT